MKDRTQKSPMRSPSRRPLSSRASKTANADTLRKKNVKECACGRGVECIGLTEAFRIMGDPRCYHVELPKYRKDPPAYKYVFRNNLREAYLRNLAKGHPLLDQSVLDSSKKIHIALHHFHPDVVLDFYQNPMPAARKHRVPISITQHELKSMGIEYSPEDSITSMTGKPTGGYYFVPSYPHAKSVQDLKQLIQSQRLASTKTTNADTGTGASAVELKIKQYPLDAQIKASDLASADTNNDRTAKQTETRDTELNAAASYDTADTIDSNDPAPRGGDEGTQEKNHFPTQPLHVTDLVENASISHVKNAPVAEGNEKILVGAETEVFSPVDAQHALDAEREDDTKGKMMNSEATSVTRSSIGDSESTSSNIAVPAANENGNSGAAGAEKNLPSVGDSDTDRIDVSNGIYSHGSYVDGDFVSDDDVSKPLAPLPSTPTRPESPILDPNAEVRHVSFSPNRPSESYPTETSQEESQREGLDYDHDNDSQRRLQQQMAITSSHHLPGTDPTIRIQVHNDMIFWESKRRSQFLTHFEWSREQWTEMRTVLKEGGSELRMAKRLVLGFAKAGQMFADAMQDIQDDKFLDNRGKTVKNSFRQNRLYQQRNAREYTIEDSGADGQTGQSALLGYVLQSQQFLATQAIENSRHMENEILSEIYEMKEEFDKSSAELEALGEQVISDLQHAEKEVSKVWNVFDAMVTGDLMEYSMHGSTHGSMHGGGYGGGSIHSIGGSFHGFLATRGESDANTSSAAHSPLVRAAFRQLGGVGDGWLIETYYRSSVLHQQRIASSGDKMLRDLYTKIVDLEDRRQQKLHRTMLAFVPRQRRLFMGVPDHFNRMLDGLVGLRIDEESLQAVIDGSIKDRTHTHHRNKEAHKSSIMNRSRLQTGADSEIDGIGSLFGDPFQSPMMLLPKVIEMKMGGLTSIVGAGWRVVFTVLTSDKKFHIFELPAHFSHKSSAEAAYDALLPASKFENWEQQARRNNLLHGLTPNFTLDFRSCSLVVSSLRKRQVEIVEEKGGGGGGARLFPTNGSRQKKYIFQLGLAAEMSEYLILLEEKSGMKRRG